MRFHPIGTRLLRDRGTTRFDAFWSERVVELERRMERGAHMREDHEREDHENA